MNWTIPINRTHGSVDLDAGCLVLTGHTLLVLHVLYGVPEQSLVLRAPYRYLSWIRPPRLHSGLTTRAPLPGPEGGAPPAAPLAHPGGAGSAGRMAVERPFHRSPYPLNASILQVESVAGITYEYSPYQYGHVCDRVRERERGTESLRKEYAVRSTAHRKEDS